MSYKIYLYSKINFRIEMYNIFLHFYKQNN